MNNLNDIRILVREIISEEFRSSISKGYFQSVDLGKGAPNKKKENTNNNKEIKDTINPFENNTKNMSGFDSIFKKIALNIKKHDSSLLDNDEFKELNKEYRKLFEFFIDSGKIPGGLERFITDKLKPFLKKNQKYLKFKELKNFYGI